MSLSAFTMQSNLLCLIMAAVTLVYVIKKTIPCGRFYIFFKGMSLVSILLTFFVYNLVLKPYIDVTDEAFSKSLNSILLHVAVPLMMLGDFLFFEVKGYFKTWYPFAWAAFPIFYIVYTAVYKALGGVYNFVGDTVVNFPYFFLDYETYGYKTVGIWLLFIVIGFIGFSYLLVGLDKLFARRAKR